jgi:hypothetical protein
MVANNGEVCRTTGYLETSPFNDDTIRIYASSMPPSMQSFETVILLQVQGVLYLYYWAISTTAKPTCY